MRECDISSVDVTEQNGTKREEVMPMPRKRKSTKKRLSRVSVRAERRSEPDWDRFAWALLQHARILSESNNAKAQTRKGKSDS